MTTTRRLQVRLARSNCWRELRETRAIKFAGLAAKYKASVTESYSAKVADAFPRGGMEQHRVGDLWRNPHATTRAMLLKVHFVGRPQIQPGRQDRLTYWQVIDAVPVRLTVPLTPC